MKCPPYGQPDAMTDYHEWDDGLCKHCGLTVAETYERPATSPFKIALLTLDASLSDVSSAGERHD